MKQGDAIGVDSTCSPCRRQVCKCGCFTRGNVISRERGDRLGSLKVSPVAVVGNLRSTVRLRTRRTDRVGDRGPPQVEGQVKKIKCSNETESGEEYGNVGKRDDAVQPEMDRQPRVCPSETVMVLRA